MKSTNWNEYETLVAQGYDLIDIREQYETDKGTVKGAITIPGSIISQNIKIIDPNKKYIIFCQSSGRSKFLINQLLEQGYNEENLIDMAGGYNGYLLMKK